MGKILILSAIAVFVCLSEPAWANPIPLWQNGGIVINNTIGNTLQENPKFVKAADGNYIIAWQDHRFGNPKIFTQKVNEEGQLLWKKSGLPASLSQKDELYPQVLQDLIGGAYVIWQDNRSGNFNIYAQRVDALGNAMFTKEAIPICPSQSGQVFPELASDGAGGFIAVFYESRDNVESVYAQRINPEGKRMWRQDGILVSRQKGTSWFPKILSDKDGGAYIIWADKRSGNSGIYSQHLDGNGNKTWKDEGIEICGIPSNKENFQIAANGEKGFYVVWDDNRQGYEGVYLQQIDPSGKILFDPSGKFIAKRTKEKNTPQVAADGENGAIVAWSDPYAGDLDIYAQRVSPGGQVMWGDGGIPVVQLRGSQDNPRLISEDGGFYVTWEDKRNSKNEVFAQKILKDGVLAFPKQGILASEKLREAKSVDLKIGQAGGLMLCYQDNFAGNHDIYMQKILPDGFLGLGNAGCAVNNTEGAVAKDIFRVVSDKDENLFFVFEDKRNGFPNIYVQKVNQKGGLLWGKDAKPVHAGHFSQNNPEIVLDDAGGVYVAFEDCREGPNPFVYAQYFDEDGKQGFEAGLKLTPKIAHGPQKKPVIIPDGENGAIVFFSDARISINSADVYAQRIDNAGELLWGEGGKLVASGDCDQKDISAAKKAMIAAFVDYRNGEQNPDIYAQRVNLSGKSIWQEDGVPICEAPDTQRDPYAIDDGQNGAVVTWTDNAAKSYDIFAQRINAQGQTLWMKDGIPVCQMGRAQEKAKSVLTNSDRCFVAWQDYRYGNWDIFGQILNFDGMTKFSQEGVDGLAICTAEGAQYNPVIIKQDGKSIIAWEDYRNGNNYSIYTQAIEIDGNIFYENNGSLLTDTKDGGRLPHLVNGQKTNYFVAWQDPRNNKAILAQKFKL